jgi:hypothetical protein
MSMVSASQVASRGIVHAEERQTGNLPMDPTKAYSCAECYTTANAYSNLPFQQCLAQCQNVDAPTLKCIQSSVARDAYVLPEHIQCVNKVAAREPIPVSQCQTLCLAEYNNCVGEGSDSHRSCVTGLTHCQTQCK